MSSATNNYNRKTTNLNRAIERENLNNILKFGLSSRIAQHIDSCFILNDIHIDNSTIVLNINLNL